MIQYFVYGDHPMQVGNGGCTYVQRGLVSHCVSGCCLSRFEVLLIQSWCARTKFKVTSASWIDFFNTRLCNRRKIWLGMKPFLCICNHLFILISFSETRYSTFEMPWARIELDFESLPGKIASCMFSFSFIFSSRKGETADFHRNKN